MKGTIRNWGNSLAIRIPRDYASTLNIQDGSDVKLELTEQGLLIVPSRPKRHKRKLADLLIGVTPELIGGEMDWGEPQGSEVW
ncbi:AbrB/MazE/SpoVT family DNA-binding domain-containing protein (plasmid) [Deinococcus psychrotolerans]|uniref:AbrB/MazE/SpoVT family DNA-binding domain-containing protein n=1 Tax=Deinococcus psychrotolerans TaxID=2489213 RepID=A0A3G8YL10_9DEIO|nr:AbrB/MazE/SpoVT family DNA-binding domain-containing protein [Deinococcus psychrotolerans]AZI45360.1 AbrB/MazE/SpoVT family DNA-binding domain-containing protein [Deinococcus psychrotolerans]